MTRRSLLFLLALASFACACKSLPPDGVHVEVPVVHDWLWTGGIPMRLEAVASSDSLARADISMRVYADTTLMRGDPPCVLESKARARFRGGRARVRFSIASLAPGFYRVEIDSCAPFNIGVRPEEIASPQDKQPDFDEFWNATLAELAAVDPEYTLTLLPEHSSENRRLYRLEARSLGGELMGGYYCEPVKEGRYPVMIGYMGYGAEPYFFDPDAAPETVEFLVSVRGQGIFLGTTPRDWDRQGLADRETYYYRGAFADVVRAVDFVSSREKCDPGRIFALGESQGGAFTWIAAALDDRLAAIAPAVPFLGDYPDYAKIVGWPMGEIIAEAANLGITREELFRTLSYFDVKNFTDRVKCPVYMAFGLQDPTCPPHTNFSGYNQVPGEKSYFCVPLCGHAMWLEPSWSKERKEWLEGFL